jgi:hypothetical protein
LAANVKIYNELTDVYVQRKLDGWRVLVSVDSTGDIFVHSKANVLFRNEPLLSQLRAQLRGFPAGVLDGELVAYDSEGVEVSANVASVFAGDSTVQCAICVFDFLEQVDGADDAPYQERYSRLQTLLPQAVLGEAPALVTLCPLLDTLSDSSSEAECLALGRHCIENSWEGLVFRSARDVFRKTEIGDPSRQSFVTGVKCRPDHFAPSFIDVFMLGLRKPTDAIVGLCTHRPEHAASATAIDEEQKGMFKLLSMASFSGDDKLTRVIKENRFAVAHMPHAATWQQSTWKFDQSSPPLDLKAGHGMAHWLQVPRQVGVLCDYRLTAKGNLRFLRIANLNPTEFDLYNRTAESIPTDLRTKALSFFAERFLSTTQRNLYWNSNKRLQSLTQAKPIT